MPLVLIVASLALLPLQAPTATTAPPSTTQPPAQQQGVDLTPFGIAARVKLPKGARLQAGGDGAVVMLFESGDRTSIEIMRGGQPGYGYAEHKARIEQWSPLVVDVQRENGEYTIGWKQTDEHHTLFHALDEGRLLCQVNALDPAALNHVCKSLRPERRGAVVRVVALEMPTLVWREERWRLVGKLRVERDGVPVPGAHIKVHNAELAASSSGGGHDGFDISDDGVRPGMSLRVEWAASASEPVWEATALACPGDAAITSPRPGERMVPSTVKWRPPQQLPFTDKPNVSVEVQTFDVKERVGLPGGALGWATAKDDLMMLLLPEGVRAPYLVTITARGEPSSTPAASTVACHVARSVVTAGP